MSERADLSRVAHAAASLAAAGLTIFLVATFVAGALAQLSAKFDALVARKESVAALTARLEETRTKTHEALAAIGASPHDLSALASPVSARSLVNDACAAIPQSLSASCVFEEAPLTKTMSSHRARLTAAGPLSEIVANLNAAAGPPLSISMLTIRPGAGEGIFDVVAVIEVTGARSPENPS